MKICPACEEPLKDGAIVCSHCGHQLAPIPAVAESGARPTSNYFKIGCGVLIILAVALVLWAFTGSYRAGVN